MIIDILQAMVSRLLVYYKPGIQLNGTAVSEVLVTANETEVRSHFVLHLVIGYFINMCDN